jgi:hypothetical protein
MSSLRQSVSHKAWQLESFTRSRDLGAVAVRPAPLSFAPAQQFVFTHVPKTGGLTMRAILAIIAVFKGWSWEEVRGAPSDAVDAYRGRSPDALAAARFVWGHFPYGLHNPAMPHIALLRDPIDLILSNYAMAVGRGTCAMGASLVDMLPTDNLQTRLLSGLPEMLAPGSVCTAAVLDRALDNLLNRYALVADINRFDDFVSVLLTMLGAPAILYFRRNMRSVDLPDDLIAALAPEAEQHTVFDRALFRAIKGKVRIGLAAAHEPASQANMDCLAFSDETGRQYVNHPAGPDTAVAALQAKGVTARQHVFNADVLEFRATSPDMIP